MIRVHIRNHDKGRNEPTFRPFMFVQQQFRDMGIEFVSEKSSYDFEFIGMADFIDKKVSLEESIDKGVEFVNKLSGDYFLFDGSDSTSLMGAYEVFNESRAIYLFKNQLLKEREMYKTPYAFNKWFFKSGSALDLTYDIPEKTWDKIKLSGWNLGWLLPHYHNFQQRCVEPIYDVCAVYQGYHPQNYDHTVRNDLFYTGHRVKAWEELEPLKGKLNILTSKLPQQEYYQKLWQSKIALSPFGMGEVCFRDFELMMFGVPMIKPVMDMIHTHPNPYLADRTYIAVDLDWKNLSEKLEEYLAFPEKLYYIVEHFRDVFSQQYQPGDLCRYWHKIFSELNNVTTE